MFIALKFSDDLFELISILVLLKLSVWHLHSGNLQAILAVACLSPVGALLSGLYKPYLFGFCLVHTIRAASSQYPIGARFLLTGVFRHS